jgi:glucosamine-6-phosphate deaminase
MGGTFDRLVDQGHEVHVAYQTSGNIAVSDEEALRYAEVALDISSENNETIKSVVIALQTRKINKDDELIIRKIKGQIRRKESLGATRFFGLPDNQVHFLDMPFYETGTVKKNNLGAKDIEIVSQLILDIEPQQIFAAGDLADPHGTHKICLDAIFASIENLKKEPFIKDCWVWLYRGAWQEWEPQEIEMAVPMSENQVLKKRKAVFYHQSQKDNVMFQGEDSREFWVRVEERTKTTADKYNALGLAEYTAMEAFKRYYF